MNRNLKHQSRNFSHPPLSYDTFFPFLHKISRMALGIKELSATKNDRVKTYTCKLPTASSIEMILWGFKLFILLFLLAFQALLLNLYSYLLLRENYRSALGIVQQFPEQPSLQRLNRYLFEYPFLQIHE